MFPNPQPKPLPLTVTQAQFLTQTLALIPNQNPSSLEPYTSNPSQIPNFKVLTN